MTATPRAHVAMFSIAAHGHVNPSLEVIRELVARGHRVSYAIPASFAERVAAAGAEPVIYTSVLPTEDNPEGWGTELIDNIEPFLADAIQALPRLAKAFEGDEPDLVLHDITSYPARVLAHRWGVPAVSLWPNLVPWEGYEEEVGEPATAELKQTERGRAYYARFEEWLTDNGLGDVPPDDFVARPRRALVLIPEALQPNADRVDRSVYTFVGACQGERADQGSGSARRTPGRCSWSRSDRRSPTNPASTASASGRSVTCPAGTWCSRSALTSTRPSSGTYRPMSRCTPGCPSCPC